MKQILRTIACMACVVLISCTGFAQQFVQPSDDKPAVGASPSPKFDLADAHVSPHSNTPFMRGGNLRGDQFIVRQASMVDLISTAYGVSGDNVLSGPAWLDTNRFDIVAKAPRTTSQDDAKLMLRALLADRFHLVVHNDTKPIPTYVLRVDKGGLKMKQADESEAPNLEEHHTPTDLPPGTPAYYSITVKNMTMPRLREVLSDFATAYLPKPVIDATDLKGGYDFDLHWTWRPVPDGLTIFDAVDKQLGLKLALENYPTPVVVVDSVNDKPTPNPPEVKENLPPPPPAEFDVAVITPSKPETQLGLRVRGGEVNVTGITPQFLIAWAWNLNPNDKEALIGAPKWMSEDHYDILGKAAPDPQTAAAKGAPQIDFDSLQEMMRNLVTERFKLQSHMADHDADAYSLVAVNPKMKKGDPMARSGCKEGPGPDGKDPRIANPILGRLLTCTNITMAEFGDLLRAQANGYIYYPVLDSTGLEGGYDFTLSFSTIGQLHSGPPQTSGNSSNSSSNSSDVSEPNGGLSLFDAVKQQIGLKLEKQRRPETGLVIDHIEQKPTDN
jgi:uncharacterized protein (TIGR03435 family)